MTHDSLSTIAGGTTGLLLLQTVRWEAVPHGEFIKIGVSFGLFAVGYLMYREKPR